VPPALLKDVHYLGQIGVAHANQDLHLALKLRDSLGPLGRIGEMLQ
jgi:hypothetical protein